MKLLILASESKRRVEILRMLGFKFLVIPSRIEEKYYDTNPLLIARQLSKEKALKVWREYKYSVVLGADTIVVIDGRILGKPKTQEEAYEMLKTLSGKWHKVITAVSIVSDKYRKTFHDTALVKLKNLTHDQIDEYIHRCQPLDKAGAYAVQGFGAVLIERIKGDFYTVMGLPAGKTYSVLKSFLA